MNSLKASDIQSMHAKETVCSDVQQSESEIDIDFEHTKHFFAWSSAFSGRDYCVQIRDTNEVTFYRLGPKGGLNYEEYMGLWNHWGEIIHAKCKPEVFEYPTWGLHQRHVETALGYTATILLCLILSAFMTPVISFLLIFAPVFLWVFVRLALPKPLGSISLVNGGFRISFANGKTYEYSYNDLKHYELRTLSSYISLRDRTRLHHLERVSYWPILRQRLLSKLEPEIHTSTQ